MSKRKFLWAALLPLSVALGGCVSGPEATRSVSFNQIGLEAALTELSLRFRAETPNVVLFDFDADVLDDEARTRLDEQAAWIIAHPQARFRIAGHTDKVGGQSYNEELAMRRAVTVLGYLVSRGIDASRLEAMVSYGEDFPVVYTENPERSNRRVTTDVLGFIQPETNAVDGGEQPLARGYEPSAPDAVLVTDAGPAPSPTSVSATTTTTSQGTSQTGGSTGGASTGGTTSGSTGEPASTKGGGSKANSGRGNGDEGSDPGKSGGKNNGGDE